MTSEKTTGKEDLNADIVIIGAGGAGLAAAATALEMGCTNVVLLEKAAAPGGNSLFAEGPFAVESPVQKRAGSDASRDEFVRKSLRWSHWKVNSRIIRAFVDKSGDTIKWLEEKGLKFDTEPLVPNEKPLTWHVAEGGGPAIISALRKNCKDRGVRILVRTRAKKLLTGPAGNVTGVLAENDGKEFTVTAKSVVITTGGFGANKELLAKYCPDYYDGIRSYGVPFNTGDGLLMALEVGAATEGLGLIMISGPTPVCDRGLGERSATVRLEAPGTDKVKEVGLRLIGFLPCTVWVNKKGRRFVDEAGPNGRFLSGFPINHQLDHISYTLFDSTIVRHLSEQGIGGRAPGDNTFRLYATPVAGPLPGLEKGLRAQADRGNLKIANSLDELAGLIGVDPKALTATIDEYNAACDRGYDPIFAKAPQHLMPLRKAPYYAIEGAPIFLDTNGGIKVNELMEVLDRRDDAIPGLYAAGVTVGGWEGDVYDFELPGSASGFALNSGRIAAESAFRFVSGQR